MTIEAFRSLIPSALEDRLQAALRQASAWGAEGAEAFVTVSRSHKAKVRNGQLDELTASKRGGLGFRILREGRTGIATTTDLGKASFDEVIRQAWDVALLGDPDPWLRQAAPSGTDDLPSRWDPRVEALRAEDRIQRAFALETAARRASSRVVAVRQATWSDGVGAQLLLTQRGVRVADLGSSCSASIELAVERDGDRQSAWHWEMGRHPGEVDVDAIGVEAVRKGELKLNPTPLPSGRYPVLLHPEVAVDLFGLLAGMLSAESVLKGRSLFAGRLETPIASPCLTLVDDARLRLPDGRLGLGSTPWDGEGLPTVRKNLLDQGVLKTYLHTLRTAAEMGCEPNASATRSPGSNPSVTTFNLFPEPGSAAPEELAHRAWNGVLITELMGLHTVNPVSGDLSLGASGLRIREGRIAEPVDRMTFAGNLKDLLTRIVDLGNDLRWYGSNAGLTILLDEMPLGGA